LVASEFIITSIEPPNETYKFLDTAEPLKQLMRRINTIIEKLDELKFIGI
jgi:hypothetical protein